MSGAGPANRLILGAIGMATIAGCGLSLTVALLSVRLDALGYSARAIGLSTAAGGVASLLCAPFIPRAARSIGVARLLLIALLLGGLTLVGFVVTSGYAAWLALRFAVGLFITVLFVMSEYWISAASSSATRGFVIGLYATSLGVGFAIGPVLLAAVGSRGALPFLVGAALFWLAILPLLASGRGAPEIASRSRTPLWRFLKEAPAATAAGFLHGAIEVAGISLLPVYALRAGVGPDHGALYASLFVVGNTVSQIPLGMLSDRVDRRALLLALAGMGLVGAVLLAAIGLASPVVFGVMLLLWGGTVGGLYPVGLAAFGDRYRDGELAGANAAFVMTYSLGMLVGPPLVGVGLDLAPPGGFFLAIAAMIGLYIIASFGWLLARPETGAAETRSAP